MKTDCRMNHVVSFLLLILLATLGNFSFAQEADIESAAEPAHEVSRQDADKGKNDIDLTTIDSSSIDRFSQAAADKTDARARHIEVVLEENRLLKEFQDSLLSTVHWSLTVVVTMLLVLAGINWFANFKFYERDKTQLKDDLEGVLTSKVNEGANEARKIKLEALEEVDQRLDSRLSDYSKRFVALDVHGSSMHELHDGLKDLEHKLEKMETDLDLRLSKSKFDNAMTDFYFWDSRDVPGVAITALATALQSAAKTGDKWRVSHVLGHLENSLSTYFIGKEMEIEESVAEWIIDAIIDAKHLDPEMAEKVSSLLLDVPRAGES